MKLRGVKLVEPVSLPGMTEAWIDTRNQKHAHVVLTLTEEGVAIQCGEGVVVSPMGNVIQWVPLEMESYISSLKTRTPVSSGEKKNLYPTLNTFPLSNPADPSEESDPQITDESFREKLIKPIKAPIHRAIVEKSR